jgi:hypothetical protein
MIGRGGAARRNRAARRAGEAYTSNLAASRSNVVAAEMVVNNKTPPPLFSVSIDCEGVETICFDRFLQLLILRCLLVNDNRKEIEEAIPFEWEE